MTSHELVPDRGYPFKVVRDGFWITTRPSKPLEEDNLFGIKEDERIYRVPGDPLGRGVDR